MKNIYFILLTTLVSYGQTQIGSDINGETPGENSGSSVSLSSDGKVLAIAAPFHDVNGSKSGQVKVYKNTLNSWKQVGNNINGENVNAQNGRSISLSSDGSIIAIATYFNDGQAKNYYFVRVYQNVNSIWTQIGANIEGETSGNDEFGSSLALSFDGTILAIGAPANKTNGALSGQVKVYKNISGTWLQIGNEINGEASQDQSGNSVALSSDGTILAIGALNNSSANGQNSGHVRVYKNMSNNWTQIGSDIDGEAKGDLSGKSVSLSSDGTILAVGAFRNDGNGTDSGHVRVYKNTNSKWTQIGADINGEATFDFSGWKTSLSSDGTILATGTPYNDANGINSGHVRVYKNVSGSWTQILTDIDGKVAGDSSGTSLSLSSDGTVLAIGSPNNDDNGLNTGQVRVFNSSPALASNSFVLNNFSIFPNPVSNTVTIQLQNDLELQLVNFYNLLGQLLKTSTTNEIPISDLSKGTYFVEVVTTKGKATKTIIVQ